MPDMANNNIELLGASSSVDRVAEAFNGRILPNCKSIFVFGMDEHDNITWEGCAVKRAYLLWALEQFKLDVLNGESN